MTANRHWGPSFGYGRHWGPNFPREADVGAVFRPVTVPATGATFILQLDADASISMQWETDVRSMRSGLEQRASNLTDPRLVLTGQALLNGADTLVMRAQLARFAALGLPVAVALPYESAVLTDDAIGATVFCPTAGRDWAVVGQRVAVIGWDGAVAEGVIQAATPGWLTLDAAPGAKGREGARVMPVVSMYLEPQLAFARYPVALERWSLAGRLAAPGYTMLAIAATLSLADPVTVSSQTQGIVFRARTSGAAGNAITVTMSADSLSGIEFSDNGGDVAIRFVPGSTLSALAAAIASASALIEMVGTYTGSDTLTVFESEFTARPLAGGRNEDPAPVGVGATVTMHDGKPVWDRPLLNDATLADGIQAMTERIDLGGIVANVGVTKQPDWSRGIDWEAPYASEWQWCKAFLDAVRGRWKSWWLASWRPDLLATGTAAGAAAVKATLALAPPVTASGALDGLSIRYKTAGAVGNGYLVQFVGNALTSTGEIEEAADGVIVRFVPGTTTVANVIALFAGRTRVELIGAASNTAAVLARADDEFYRLELGGGSDAVPGRLTIHGSAGSFRVWYPRRSHLQVLMATGAVLVYKITKAVDNADGTITLDLDAAAPSGAIAMVSWLELVRFETDEIVPTFHGHTFRVQTTARGVAR